ncbi:hypothetical protein BDZ89DRAFT_1135071 [Hymenopellis radicata]|nr:hypothetical protein BDZ89DRAFT_1135071 [Hymenopellis radicata]
MASMFRAYNALLIRRPFASQCATAAVLFGAGDVIAQQVIEGKGKNHDSMRTLRLSFYGGAMFGPAITAWYIFLGRLTFKSPTRGVIYRVWLDQFVITPVIVGAFFASMATLEGKPFEAKARIQEKYSPTLIRNWGVFIPTQLINFWIVPPQWRFGVVGVVSLFWNTYLSAVNASDSSVEKVDEVIEKEVKEIVHA